MITKIPFEALDKIRNHYGTYGTDDPDYTDQEIADSALKVLDFIVTKSFHNTFAYKFEVMPPERVYEQFLLFYEALDNEEYDEESESEILPDYLIRFVPVMLFAVRNILARFLGSP